MKDAFGWGLDQEIGGEVVIFSMRSAALDTSITSGKHRSRPNKEKLSFGKSKIHSVRNIFVGVWEV